MLLPFDDTKKSEVNHQDKIALAGDIGATKTNLELIKWGKNNSVVLYEAKCSSHDYKNIIQLTDEFLKGLPLPDVICFGVAGPVLTGHAKLPNIDWEIDSKEISNHFGIKNIHLINDLEATAYGLAVLTEKDIAVIHKGNEPASGNAAVIAPGTGLGEAGLYWEGNIYHPFATEGGHCDFAPRNDFDFELYNFLNKRFGHVSWERLVCGPGIVNIYQFLRDAKKRHEPVWLQEKFINADAASVISQHTEESEICKETMRLFIRYLAYESANLVLKLKATGGLFIGGGIAPHVIPLFQNNIFYSSFCQSGRLNYLLERTPVKIIQNTKSALLGSAWYACNN